MVKPARVRRGRCDPPPRSPPIFCTLAPNAMRSKTAIARPTSPAQASARAPATVSRTYLTEVPIAASPVRNTSDETPRRSADVYDGPSAAAPAPHVRRPARDASAPVEGVAPEG